MKELLAGIAKVVDRVRTPLALAGLAFIVLFSLYKQILGLGVFSQLEGDRTFSVLDEISENLFWLALIAMILGFVAYVASPFLRRVSELSSSNVKLVDASLDRAISVSDADDDGELAFADVEAKINAVDFKFVNQGTATAVLHAFELEIVDFELDVTPVLEFSYQPFENLIKLGVENHGWGDARECRVRLTGDVIDQLFPGSALALDVDVLWAGLDSYLMNLSVLDLDQVRFRELIERRASVLDVVGKAMRQELVSNSRRTRQEILNTPDFSILLSHHEKWCVEEFFSLDPDQWQARRKWLIEKIQTAKRDDLPLRLTVEVGYTREDGRRETYSAEVLTGADSAMAKGVLWVHANGFSYDWHEVSYAPLSSDEAYAVVLQADSGTVRRYNISRSIKPGDADRFHIVLAALKSGRYTVRLKFAVDGRREVCSALLELSLSRAQNQPLPKSLQDGATFKIENGRIMLGR